MAKNNILSLTGFDDLLNDIEKAQGSAAQAAAEAVKEGADEYKKQLTAAANAADVPADLVNKIQKTVKVKNDFVSARVGWNVPAYNPKNPADAFKVIFLNYGTPRRTTRSGANRGKINPRGFIGKAKRAARSKIKKAQENALKKILGDLAE